MSRSVELETTRSGGRLGGISTMVTQADVCPSCGGRHEARRRSFWERSEATGFGCPVVVHGMFPVLIKLPDPTEVILDGPFDSSPDRTTAVVPSPLEPIPTGRRLGQIPIPWPTPSFDEAYL
jgi:hypothetical protein